MREGGREGSGVEGCEKLPPCMRLWRGDIYAGSLLEDMMLKIYRSYEAGVGKRGGRCSRARPVLGIDGW